MGKKRKSQTLFLFLPAAAVRGIFRLFSESNMFFFWGGGLRVSIGISLRALLIQEIFPPFIFMFFSLNFFHLAEFPDFFSPPNM